MEYIRGIEMIIGVLLGTAYITLGERKIMGRIQRRVGPEEIGDMQPIADGLKIMTKENIYKKGNINNKWISIISPIWILYISILLWIVIPINYKIIYREDSLSKLLWIAISSISIYGILYTGWSSNSKYGTLGTLRGIAQKISYEISMGIIVILLFITKKTGCISDYWTNQIYISNIWIWWPILILFYISLLGETNRHPFDLLEAESELVAGAIVEYSGSSFAYIYIGEYMHLIWMGQIVSILFIGNIYYSLLFWFLPILIRGVLPRLRYDQLMILGWTSILPLSIAVLIFYLSI